MLTLDSTQAKCFSNCKKRYKLNYVDQLRKLEYGEDSVDIRFGAGIHAGLELLTDNCQDVKAITDRFIDNFVDLPGEDVKTVENGVKLLQEFVPYYRANFGEWETLAVEKVGHVNIGGKVDYIVKIDRVVKWRGNIYVVDWKTTKTTRKHGYFDRFRLDFQPTGYVKWCQLEFGQCSGFIPVGLFMGYRKRKYKGEPAGFHCSFDYTIVNRTQDMIDSWGEDMLGIADEIERCKVSNHWRHNPEHCGSYRGCQYMQICESCDDEMVMDTLYEKFDATKYLEV